MEKKKNRKRAKIPREYEAGTATFMGLTLFCTQDTLIPRKETELLIKVALEYIHDRQNSHEDISIIDMGTGSGNICVALAVNSDNTQIFASDLSPRAIDVAKKNAKKYKVEDRISFFCGDLFAPFKGKRFQEKIDMVVCNPPYIPTSSLSKMDPAITEFEPIMALDAGVYGIDFFRRLINDALDVLKSKGALVFEIGEGQEKLVTRLITRNKGYRDIKYFDDGEHIRVIYTTKN
jgi:release factor glutamine methyltransferase